MWQSRRFYQIQNRLCYFSLLFFSSGRCTSQQHCRQLAAKWLQRLPHLQLDSVDIWDDVVTNRYVLVDTWDDIVTNRYVLVDTWDDIVTNRYVLVDTWDDTVMNSCVLVDTWCVLVDNWDDTVTNRCVLGDTWDDIVANSCVLVDTWDNMVTNRCVLVNTWDNIVTNRCVVVDTWVILSPTGVCLFLLTAGMILSSTGVCLSTAWMILLPTGWCLLTSGTILSPTGVCLCETLAWLQSMGSWEERLWTAGVNWLVACEVAFKVSVFPLLTYTSQILLNCWQHRIKMMPHSFGCIFGIHINKYEVVLIFYFCSTHHTSSGFFFGIATQGVELKLSTFEGLINPGV